ncbi:hypothetical protein [Undibacterium flavidum]|uniref:Farnesoic acid O-methyl transferase domain-containing protein n=1 Tax=Undibacterium flavidum TaxID=2762297 RepID=A0ABR6Y6H1_9BURK|nr:hypothetical protein [Undibacterium flavidum]MBC3872218.1 hypothetical protein [Undibacterium flavidum]
MKTEISYSSSKITVHTILSETQDSNADLIVSECGSTNRKSRISIQINGKIIEILFLWSHFSDEASLCILWEENSQLLFLGGGSVSAVVDPINKIIKHCNYPMLFWSWELIGQHILELGELECRLYKLNGDLVGQTSVDPPYEYKITEKTIEFSSMVFGSTSIKY